MKDSFVLYTKYRKQIKSLTMEQRGILFTAILMYESDEEQLPEMDAVTEMAFDFISADLDENRQKYEDKCAANSRNGAKGGRPRRQTLSDNRTETEKPNGFYESEKTEKTERFSKNQTQAKKADNDMINDYDSSKEKAKAKKKSSDTEGAGFLADVATIIDHLNKKAGTHYRVNTETTISAIRARMKDGYSLQDFLTVIDKKCSEWMGTDMEKHLNPETLFRPSHFEKYLNQKIIAGGSKPQSRSPAGNWGNFPQRNDAEHKAMVDAILRQASAG